MLTDAKWLDAAVIHVLDAGGFKRRNGRVIQEGFGCARLDRRNTELTYNSDLGEQALQIAADLDADRPVVYAVEATLFFPAPPRWEEIFQCREGECLGGGRNYPWSASAGREAMLNALAELPWILDRIAKTAKRKHRGYSVWPDFISAGNGIGIIEAMIVSAPSAHGGELDPDGHRRLLNVTQPHQRDAAAGAIVLDRLLRDVTTMRSVISEPEVFSLAAAALLYSSLSDDHSAMRKPSMVFYARKPVNP